LDVLYYHISYHEYPEIDASEKVRVCDSCFGSGPRPPQRILDLIAKSKIVAKDFSQVAVSTPATATATGTAASSVPKLPLTPVTPGNELINLFGGDAAAVGGSHPAALATALPATNDTKRKEFVESIGAIASKMTTDGLSADEISHVLSSALGPLASVIQIQQPAPGQPAMAAAPPVVKAASAEVAPALPIPPAAPVGGGKYEKFFKMQKMHLPEGAIRQKMTQEGLAESEIDDFFAGKISNEPAAVVTAPAATEAPAPTAGAVNERFEKFFKMQKMHLPDGAIRQKMTQEGLSETEIDDFFAGKVSNAAPAASAAPTAAPAEATVPTAAATERYEKFFKMQKMHLPEGAIRQKMTQEGFTDAEIDGFFAGKLVAAPSGSAGASAIVTTSGPAADTRYEKFRPALQQIKDTMKADGLGDADIQQFLSGPLGGSEAPAAGAASPDTSKYEKFFKMQKMHLPDGAIRQKMTQEGLSEAEIEGFFSGDLVSSTGSSSQDGDAKFAKYLPMKHKLVGDMKASGFTDEEILSFFGGKLTAPGGPAGVDSSKYEKFRPALQEIQDKMSSDGLSAADIQEFLASTSVGDSSVAATGGASATIDSSRYEKFYKMQKMHLPDGAIRQKMTQEGLSDAEIDGFFSGNLVAAASAPPPAPAAAAGGSEKYEKFFKMQKMHLPDGAIRQKMKQEGLSEAEIDGFFSGNLVGAASAPAPAPAVAAGGTEKYEKFFKMQKMHLPDGAIRQKMTQEGLSEAEIEGFFSGNLVAAGTASEAAQGSSTSALVNPKFAKYNAMKQKLVADMKVAGFADAEITGFFVGKLVPPSTVTGGAPTGGMKAVLGGLGGLGGKLGGGAAVAAKAPAPPPEPSPFTPKSVFKPARKMRAVFLSKIAKDDLLKSVWFKIGEKTLDWDKLEVAFGEDKSAAANKAKAGDDKGLYSL
jgi:ubiquinone/menaquinone biosynthesis C-methylase UbiE